MIFNCQFLIALGFNSECLMYVYVSLDNYITIRHVTIIEITVISKRGRIKDSREIFVNGSQLIGNIGYATFSNWISLILLTRSQNRVLESSCRDLIVENSSIGTRRRRRRTVMQVKGVADE